MNSRPIRFSLCIAILIAFGIFFLWACDGSNSENDNVVGTGELYFEAVYDNTSGNSHSKMAQLDCTGEGVVTVTAAVYGSNDAFLVPGGPWDCNTGKGTISAVPAGSSRTVVIFGKDSNGHVVFRGRKSGIQVDANRENDAETIDCNKFVPGLRVPQDGAIVNGEALALEWHAVTGATEYRILVSESMDMSKPLLNVTTTRTNHTPAGLSDDLTYYWQIFSLDSYGNMGAGSQAWSFTNDTDHANVPPVTQITSPAHGLTYLVDNEIILSGSGSDMEDGNLIGESLTWESDVDGHIGTGELVTLSTLSPGIHRITLSVMDSAGLENAATVVITIARAKLPDTGQTDSYTETFGEDSDYIINPPVYTKLDQSGNDLDPSAPHWVMVRDEVTGLIWEVKSVGDENDVHNNDKRISWHDIQRDFIDRLKADNFGGYNDWRLPTIKDLNTIIKTGIIDKDPEIDTVFFPNSKAAPYWSSTSYTQDANRAWYMDFYYGGRALTADKSTIFFVRAVRGAIPSSTLVDNKDGTVTDTATGLTWQLFYAEDVVPSITRENALNYCESLDLAGYSDWRLPNVKELQSIVDYGAYNPAIDTTVFVNTESFGYWSSTSTNALTAIGVDFIYGRVELFSTSNPDIIYNVRAVRGGIFGSD